MGVATGRSAEWYTRTLRRWGCSCQSWLGVSEPRTQISTRCYGTLAPSASSTSRTRRSETAAGTHRRSSEPEKQAIVLIEERNGEP